MGGVSAGVFSVLSLIVGVALVATLVKNSEGSVGLVNAGASGFAKILSAAQGNPVNSF